MFSTQMSQQDIEKYTELARDDEWMMSALAKEDIMIFMNELGSNLSTSEEDNEKYAAILELIATLVSFYDARCRRAFKKSPCLDLVLERFDVMEIENANLTVQKINEKIVDILLICTATDDDIKKSISDIVVKKVVKAIEQWAKMLCSSINPNIMQKLLSLCKATIVRSCQRQVAFVTQGGLERIESCLIRRIQHEKGKVLPVVQSPGNVPFDASQSLFSNMAWLLDSALIHNKENCRKAYEMGLKEKLLNCLETVPLKDLDGIISALVHIIEAGVCVFSHDELNKLYYLTEAKNFQERETGLSLKRFMRNVYHGKIAGQSPPTTHEIKKESYLSYLQNASKRVPPYRKSERKSVKAADTDQSQDKSSETVLSEAETMVLMFCIHKYGVNMEKVREAFPFYPELTPKELYNLWRRLWALGPSIYH